LVNVNVKERGVEAGSSRGDDGIGSGTASLTRAVALGTAEDVSAGTVVTAAAGLATTTSENITPRNTADQRIGESQTRTPNEVDSAVGPATL
jgi:hypothetical protein